MNHEHLTEDIIKIEFIECQSAADMAWKEIYYINLFANEDTTNISDLFADGVTDLHLNDKWTVYNYHIINYCIDSSKIATNYKLIVDNDFKNKIQLIHIIDNAKLNSIGNDKYSLTKKWFYDNENNKKLSQLGKNVVNYFRNICGSKSSECAWTTFDEIKQFIKGSGFRKGFESLNKDNVFSKIYLAFLCNIYYPVNYKIENINEDGYALSEILQFIWRSAIRDGKEIWVYIPSIRMRNLLKQWIAQNS